MQQHLRTERMKPLLGTYVSLRVEGLDADTAHAACDAAFAVVSDIHAAMSFQDERSDVSRLNRRAAAAPVKVSAHTAHVLRRSLQIAAAFEDLFDPSVPPLVVWRGMLPVPRGAPPPSLGASWRDITLTAGGAVRFSQPLWISLCGIAKGYAVDCAVDVLLRFAPTHISVNAGGDMRIAGPATEAVRIAGGDGAGLVELTDAAIASSAAHSHFHPRTGKPVSASRFVT